jgi:hypothetical protein
MTTFVPYKQLQVPDSSSGPGGINLTADLKKLADLAPFISTSDPTAGDDSTSTVDPTGQHVFLAGSLWLNTNSNTLWQCLDATPTAAKWRSLWSRTENAIVLTPVGAVTGTDSRAAVLGGENNVAFSNDSVVAGGKGNNAGGGSGTITGISQANPTVVTSANHGLSTGETITISGSNSTPSINGNRTVTVLTSTTFRVAVNVTTAGNAGSWSTIAAAAYAFVGGGQNNKALGKWSHAEGYGTKAIGSAAHVEGQFCLARGSSSHAEGSGTSAFGSGSHSEGNSFANGDYSHAEGYQCVANGIASHAEGRYSAASGYASHAEGRASASGYYSHAEGSFSTASGSNSHAEGAQTVAFGSYSHAGGLFSKARLRAQWARASGAHGGGQVGTAQTTITHLFRVTTGTSTDELTLDGASASGSNRLSISSGQALSCLINVVGRHASGDIQAAFLRHVCIRNNGTTTSLVGSETSIASVLPSGWGGLTISAANNALTLQIQGNTTSALTIRWTATVLATEVADAAI